ncbi:MAG: nucleoside deaminase [Synechococcales cyanobacterium RM1_1_8]|nr:nucleoside deaminase [Synechococcales cyanobacterium RM1_1_8]
MPYDLPPPALDDDTYLTHYRWMARALELAEQAGAAGEVPVGAVIVAPNGQCLAEGENRRERDHDPTAHAEIVALRRAGAAQGRWYLKGCQLYVTLEPCPMCAGAILQGRIQTLIYGTADPKAGGICGAIDIPHSPAAHHKLEILQGILAAPAQQQLQQWFAARRAANKRDKRP